MQNWSGDRLREQEGGITQRGVKLARAAGRIVSRKRRGGFEDDDDEASLSLFLQRTTTDWLTTLTYN